MCKSVIILFYLLLPLSSIAIDTCKYSFEIGITHKAIFGNKYISWDDYNKISTARLEGYFLRYRTNPFLMAKARKQIKKSNFLFTSGLLFSTYNYKYESDSNNVKRHKDSIPEFGTPPILIGYSGAELSIPIGISFKKNFIEFSFNYNLLIFSKNQINKIYLDTHNSKYTYFFPDFKSTGNISLKNYFFYRFMLSVDYTFKKGVKQNTYCSFKIDTNLNLYFTIGTSLK
jgi:hypothetical protein